MKLAAFAVDLPITFVCTQGHAFIGKKHMPFCDNLILSLIINNLVAFQRFTLAFDHDIAGQGHALARAG